MCGIVGGVSASNIVPVLLEGLTRLEYRGYDSAGLALVVDDRLQRIRAKGRVAQLAELSQGAHGHLGIAHTRWATHGVPAERNAHPHLSRSETLAVAVVHNGIIENHGQLRESLTAKGYRFESDTDTEVIAHLVHHEMRQGQVFAVAVRAACRQLEGAYAIALVSATDPDIVIAVRHGAPLLVGIGDSGRFLASDMSALLKYTRTFILMEDGEMAILSQQDVRLYDTAGNGLSRAPYVSELSAEEVELGNFQHYMQKEVFEQPGALASTLEMVCSAESLTPALFGAAAPALFAKAEHVLILACGTSYHAGLTARYWLESVARIPTTVEVASEFRYRNGVLPPKTLVVCISQSGETADTLAALEHVKQQPDILAALCICNVPESALIRASDLKFLTRAGPEIGVASTKAFTTQLAALYVLTLTLAKARRLLTAQAEAEQLAALRHFPSAVQAVLKCEPAIKEWATVLKDKGHALFLGRGVHYPIALEGALKLKEVTYIHAEAYAAGELKHGPLALVDEDMPVIVVAPNDQLLDKLKGNMQEVRARGGQLYVFADADTPLTTDEVARVIKLEVHAGPLSPLLHVIPLQLLAYHTALAKGTDVDKPRNLAKSVTTE